MFGFLAIAGFILARQAVLSHADGIRDLAMLKDVLREARTEVKSVLLRVRPASPRRAP